MNLKDLGRRVRQQRERRGLKQIDVAHALQVSAQAVSKWERGENAPDIAVLGELCTLLGVTTDWLLGRGQERSDTFPATVFCTTLRGFAKRAAQMAPREVAAWTNGIFLSLTEAFLQFDGVPVKYVGDGFLGFFSGARHADRALAAARLARRTTPHPDLVLALHSGPVYLGAIGHPEYARPDVIGDTVNTAFLVMLWAVRQGSHTVLTQATAQTLAAKPAGKAHRRVRIPGVGQLPCVYELKG